MVTKTLTKRPVVPTPQNLNEAAEFVRQIGEAERAIEQSNHDMNTKLEEIKRPFVDQVEQHQQQLTELVEGLYAYAQGHRLELTDDEKKKTVTLPTGSFSWRFTPKSVSIKSVQEVLNQLA